MSGTAEPAARAPSAGALVALAGGPLPSGGRPAAPRLPPPPHGTLSVCHIEGAQPTRMTRQPRSTPQVGLACTDCASRPCHACCRRRMASGTRARANCPPQCYALSAGCPTRPRHAAQAVHARAGTRPNRPAPVSPRRHPRSDAGRRTCRQAAATRAAAEPTGPSLHLVPGEEEIDAALGFWLLLYKAGTNPVMLRHLPPQPATACLDRIGPLPNRLPFPANPVSRSGRRLRRHPSSCATRWTSQTLRAPR